MIWLRLDLQAPLGGAVSERAGLLTPKERVTETAGSLTPAEEVAEAPGPQALLGRATATFGLLLAPGSQGRLFLLTTTLYHFHLLLLCLCGRL